MADNVVDVDVSLNAKGITSVNKSIQSVIANIEGMATALRSLDKNGISTIDKLQVDPKKLQSLKLMSDTIRSMSGSITSLASAAKAVEGVDIDAYINKSVRAFKSYARQLSTVKPLQKEQAAALNATAAAADKAASATERLAAAEAKRRSLDIKEQANEITKAKLAQEAVAEQRRAAELQERIRHNTATEQNSTRANDIRAETLLLRQQQAVRKEQLETERAAERAAKDAAKERAAAARKEIADAKAAVAAEEAKARAIEKSRYAARDLAQVYSRTAIAFAAIPVAGLLAFADQEKAFANVRRVAQGTETEIDSLKSTFKDLSTETLQSFSELSNIASLGAQMDISTSSLGDFTEAVANFSTMTGVDVEEAAESLGRLAKMMGTLITTSEGHDGYKVLASQIAELGAKSVATEDDILKMSTSIVAQGRTAGFTQSQILGLSSTLSSLAIGKEWARGSVQRIFGKINKAVADGGESLRVYSSFLGMTDDEFKNLWANDPSKLFLDLTSSLARMGDKVQKQSALNALGMTSVRDSELMVRLSSNVGLLADQLAIAEKAGQSTSFMEQSMAIMTETLAAKWEMFLHALQNVGAEFGEGILIPVKLGIQALTALLNVLDAIPQPIKAAIGAVLGFIGLKAGIKAMQSGLVALAGSWLNVRRNMIEATSSTKLSWQSVIQTWKLAEIEAARLAKAGAAASNASVAGGYSKNTSAAKANTAVAVSARNANAAQAVLNKTIINTSTAFSKSGATISTTTGKISTAVVNTAKSSALLSSSLGVARTAASGLLTVLGGWWGLGITAGVFLVSSAMEYFAEKTKTAEDSINDFFNAADGANGTQGFLDAIITDTQAAARGVADTYTALEVAVGKTDGAYSSATDGMFYYVDASGTVVQATKEVAAQQGLLQLQLGKTGEEYLRQAAIANSGISDLDNNTKVLLSEVGVNLSEFTKAVAEDQTGKAAERIVSEYKKRIADVRAQLSDEYTRLSASNVGTTNTSYSEADQAKLDALRAKLEAVSNATRTVDALLGTTGLQGAIQGAAAEASIMGQGLDTASEGLDEFGNASDGASDSVDDLNSKIKSVYDQMFAMYDASAAAQDALSQVYQSIQENGTNMDPSSDAGRANIDAIRAYMEALTQEAVAGAQQLGLTGVEANNYVYNTINDAINFLASQGIDTSMFQHIPDEIQAIIGANYVTGVVDASNLINSLDATGVDVSNRVNQIVALVNMIGKLSQTAAITANTGWKPIAGMTKGQTADAARYSAQAAAYLKSAKGVQAAMAKPQMFSNVSYTSPGRTGYSTSNSAFNPSGYRARSTGGGSRGGGGGGGGSRGGSGGGGGSSSAAKETKSAEELFEEFLSKLKSALDKALSSWWSSTVAMDAYHKQLNTMKKSIESTREKIADLRKENESLSTDLLEDEQKLRDAKFYNAIATKYGDTERMASTQTDISTAEKDIKDKKDKIAANEAEAKSLQASMFALNGYSDAAIENRAALMRLQETMVGLINSYAETGASTQEIQAYTQRLKEEFIKQATQLGFNQGEVRRLAGAFDTLKTTIGTVPRNVNINATDNGSIRGIQNAINGIRGSSPVISPWLDTSNMRRQLKMFFDGMGNQVYTTGGRSTVYNKGGEVEAGFAGGGLVPGMPPADKSKDNMLATDGNNLFSIRSGEYVISQPAVDFYGSGLMRAINTMQVPIVNVAPVSVNNGDGVMTLNPQQFNMLVQAVIRGANVVLDGNSIRRSVDNGNVRQSARGAW